MSSTNKILESIELKYCKTSDDCTFLMQGNGLMASTLAHITALQFQELIILFRQNMA
jgi:hypothetical protein